MAKKKRVTLKEMLTDLSQVDDKTLDEIEHMEQVEMRFHKFLKDNKFAKGLAVFLSEKDDRFYVYMNTKQKIEVLGLVEVLREMTKFRTK